MMPVLIVLAEVVLARFRVGAEAEPHPFESQSFAIVVHRDPHPFAPQGRQLLPGGIGKTVDQPDRRLDLSRSSSFA